MWTLNLCSGPLLAVHCDKGQEKDEAFRLAEQYYKQNLKGVAHTEGSGAEGWTDRMRLARSCLDDDLASYHSMIVVANGVAGFGLGPNKRCYELAAYLAHRIAAADSHELEPALQELAAKPKPCLQPDIGRYDLISESIPSSSDPHYAVVWHIRKNTCKVWFHAEEAQVRKRFGLLFKGPYTAAIFDPSGTIIERFGCYSRR